MVLVLVIKKMVVFKKLKPPTLQPVVACKAGDFLLVVCFVKFSLLLHYNFLVVQDVEALLRIVHADALQVVVNVLLLALN